MVQSVTEVFTLLGGAARGFCFNVTRHPRILGVSCIEVRTGDLKMHFIRGPVSCYWDEFDTYVIDADSDEAVNATTLALARGVGQMLKLPVDRNRDLAYVVACAVGLRDFAHMLVRNLSAIIFYEEVYWPDQDGPGDLHMAEKTRYVCLDKKDDEYLLQSIHDWHVTQILRHEDVIKPSYVSRQLLYSAGLAYMMAMNVSIVNPTYVVDDEGRTSRLRQIEFGAEGWIGRSFVDAIMYGHSIFDFKTERKDMMHPFVQQSVI